MTQNNSTNTNNDPQALSKDQPLFFVGIGGIGMSAIARYYLLHGFQVGGYDRVSTPITDALSEAGAQLLFQDDPECLPEPFRRADTYVIYTPAISLKSPLLSYFQQLGIIPHKRSQALGDITARSKALCVAGTHGKTSTSTLLACLMASGTGFDDAPGVNAFLGGFSLNFSSNLLLDEAAEYTVVEADEYDRSFHTLHPYRAIITSVSPDHLDIYGTEEAYREAFEEFSSLVVPGGDLLLHHDVNIQPRLQASVSLYTYARENPDADFYSDRLHYEDGELFFDFHLPSGDCYRDMNLGVPIEINVDNATAALAVAHLSGQTEEQLREKLAGFRGVHRRFERVLNQPNLPILIDDYAHHPDEIDASIRSVRKLYPDARLTVVFQPHLYSRTADFYKAFAAALAHEGQIILLPIYPAREEPIPGVQSELILEHLPQQIEACCCSKEELLSTLDRYPADVYLMLGAGDIEFLVPRVAEYLHSRKRNRV